MQESRPPLSDFQAELPFPDPALREVLESFREPAILYLPGGRIAAVNRAAGLLTVNPVVGMTVDQLLDLNPARRADGSAIHRGDLPYARALRGEIVALGERIEITLPGIGTYQTVITSTPIVHDGKVVAALSIWHDFNAYTRLLTQRRLPPAAGDPAPDPSSGEYF